MIRFSNLPGPNTLARPRRRADIYVGNQALGLKGKPATRMGGAPVFCGASVRPSAEKQPKGRLRCPRDGLEMSQAAHKTAQDASKTPQAVSRTIVGAFLFKNEGKLVFEILEKCIPSGTPLFDAILVHVCSQLH